VRERAEIIAHRQVMRLVLFGELREGEKMGWRECVCARESVCERGCISARKREGVRVCACVCVCVQEREREGEREKDKTCVCVCVRESERKREREREKTRGREREREREVYCGSVSRCAPGAYRKVG
jgi:hypothetical protein